MDGLLQNPTVSPAYGRDYKTKAEVIAAWEAGKEFSIGGPGGPYTSIRDFPGQVTLRYKKLTQAVIYKGKPKEE